MPPTVADYQILIVGAGLAGLHCALRLTDKYPNISIAIAEEYNYIGGRIFTYKPKGFPDIQWESGAGRIHYSHKLVTKYVEQYKLTKIPLPSEKEYISNRAHFKDIWKSLSEVVVKALSSLSPATLSSNTVEELMIKTYGKDETRSVLEHFPYRAELNTLRADLALKSFRHEMGKNTGFYIVKEGLGTLVEKMRQTLKDRGVIFLLNHRLSAVEPNTTPIICKFNNNARIRADKVILALHSEALKGISPFVNLPILKHLSMKPLLRTYAIFPTPAGVPWFNGMSSMITDEKLRYIIPINPKQGTIMTSYTDDDDTKPWVKILHNDGEKALGKSIVKDLREIMGSTPIPDPVYFKAHLWTKGCTYWLPGLYKPEVMSEKVMNPLPGMWQNLYVCGESYSLRQAWMEGALEHADAMLDKYFL